MTDSYDSRRVYEHLVGFVDHNTGGYQPAVTPVEPVIANLSRDNYKHEWVRKALRKAKTEGDLVCITKEGRGKFVAVGSVESIREKNSSYAERRVDPTGWTIGLANQLIQMMEDDDHHDY